MESVPFVAIMSFDRVTPLEFMPDSRTCSLEAACFEESSVSLNVTASTPVPVLYVADAKPGLEMSSIVMELSESAAIALPAESLTAPASMSSCGVVIAFTEFLSVPLRVNVSELVPFAVMVPLDRVTPPEPEPDSRTWNLDAACFEESSVSLNVTASTPVPVLYVADAKPGLTMSTTAMGRSYIASMVLPEASRTAPASMSICGTVKALTAAVFVAFRPNVMELVPFVVIMLLDNVIPSVSWPMPLTWNLDAACLEESRDSLNDTVSTPVPGWYDTDSTVGRTISAVICCTTALFWPKRPFPSTPILTEYDDLAGACFMLSVLPDISKSELSVSPAPLTSEYVGLCPRRTEFCAATLPTVRLSMFSALLSSAAYHGPRLWLKAEA